MKILNASFLLQTLNKIDASKSKMISFTYQSLTDSVGPLSGSAGVKFCHWDLLLQSHSSSLEPEMSPIPARCSGPINGKGHTQRHLSFLLSSGLGLVASLEIQKNFI